MKTKNDELLEAIQSNNYENAKIALENGADPTEDCKFLYAAEEVGMFNLLLDYGALIDDLSTLVKNQKVGMIEHAVKHPSCPFSQNEIYEEITALMASIFRRKQFEWEKPSGKALLALIRASDKLIHEKINIRPYRTTEDRHLEIDTSRSGFFSGSATPFFIATIWSSDACKIMLNNSLDFGHFCLAA